MDGEKAVELVSKVSTTVQNDETASEMPLASGPMDSRPGHDELPNSLDELRAMATRLMEREQQLLKTVMEQQDEISRLKTRIANTPDDTNVESVTNPTEPAL